MASLAAHLLNPVLRFQVKRKLAGATNARQIRKAFESPMPAPRGARFTPAILGVAGEWAEPGFGPAPSVTCLYLHGGAFIACSARTHRPITGGLAVRGVRVFAPNYRLAPEHTYPAALDDSLASWRALLDQGVDPALAVIAGDSAGGNLALALCLRARDEGVPLPARLLLFSPWTDLTGSGESALTNDRRDPLIAGAKVSEGGAVYLGGADPRGAYASPLFADLAGLPPMLIHAGEAEVLRDDSVRLDARVKQEGGTSLLRLWPVVPHVWPLFQAFLPEGRAALDESAAFIRAALPRAAAA